ncbi:L,D-transpeptidase [Oricola sp.]|uniref:L,D-transpeptidase n=1 Tax=Oricola sp. TaxID=1979950 RepID=UPI0025D74EA7|nr:L,D-transpeptidase [Oricola sp.]MCI5076467.1 L,D-transpeptidase [Oricola sp.]
MHNLRAFLLSLLLALSAGGALLAAPAAARAERVTVDIDLSDQQMTVRADGRILYRWPVSTARPGYRTPVGTYHPYRLEREWYSTIYDYAPMPWSIFFLRGYAIHGTTDLAHLGQPASHGCVRLHPDNAKALFDLVRSVGMRESLIVIRP